MVLLGGMAASSDRFGGAAAFMFLEEGLGLVTPHWPLLMGLGPGLVVLYARNGLARAGRLPASPPERLPAMMADDDRCPPFRRRYTPRRPASARPCSAPRSTPPRCSRCAAGQALRRPGRDAGRRPRPAPRRGPCHRSARTAPARRPLLGQLTGDVRPDAGRIYHSAARHHGATGAPAGPSRHRPLVPDHLGVPGPDGARERRCSRSSARMATRSASSAALDDARHVATAQALLAQVGLADRSGRIRQLR